MTPTGYKTKEGETTTGKGKEHNLGTANRVETETAGILIFRYHPSSLACINPFQHFHHLIHFRTFFRISIPAFSHDIC